VIKSSKTGRPKRTTEAEKKSDAPRKQCVWQLLFTYIMMNTWKACDEDSNSHVSKGSLKRLISRKKEEFGLGHDCIIPIETIWTQVKNKNFAVDCYGGHDSPLKELEDTIVDFLIAMSHCCQPLTMSESLVLVNSLIQGTKYQRIVAEFQSKHCAGTMKATTKKGEVGVHFCRILCNETLIAL